MRIRTTSVIARLKPEVSVAQAQAQVADDRRAAARREFPATNRGVGADVMPYAKTVLGPEVYGLLLHDARRGHRRAADRLRQRVEPAGGARVAAAPRGGGAHGARRRARLACVRQHLTEVLVLAVAGGGIGVLLSVVGMRWFTQALSVNPPPFWITFELDYRVMLFVIGLIVLASLFAGALPALHAVARRAPAPRSRTTAGRRPAPVSARFSSGLVVAELAVSCGLLIAAGLMIKSVVQLKNVQMPFAIDNVLTARVDLPPATYPDSAASIRFFERLLPKLQAVPGVEAATLSDGLPGGRQRRRSRCRSKARRIRRHSDYPLAREGIVTAGLLRHVPDDAAERPRVHARRRGDEPAGRDRQRVVRARRISRASIRSAARSSASARPRRSRG